MNINKIAQAIFFLQNSGVTADIRLAAPRGSSRDLQAELIKLGLNKVEAIRMACGGSTTVLAGTKMRLSLLQQA